MIEVRNLQKTWRRHGKTVGLLEASFTIPDGQVVGILGENGAGKTTLLRAMAGLLPARGKAVAHACKAPLFRIYWPTFSHDPLS